MNNNSETYPAYTVFADVYDEYMNEIPYDKWVHNIRGILSEYGINNGLVAELGCGTGRMTRALSNAGYDMIGIDNSEDMLAIAREYDDPILYLNQDMRELELYGTVEAFVSVCDSMNYLLSVEDLTTVLKKTNLYLEKDGLFIFDMKTEHLYRDVLGDTIQKEENNYELYNDPDEQPNDPDEDPEDPIITSSSLTWKNHYDAESRIHTYELEITFNYASDCEYDLPGTENPETYRETHRQRAFTKQEVEDAIKYAGMELVSILDADTMKEPTELTERVYYIAKECFQKGKYYE